MSLAGELNLRIMWDGNSVHGVEIKSTRPRAYRVLEGRLPDNAVQFVPMLYSVCGKAQQAAAIAAVSAAQGNHTSRSSPLERGVICEAMQEHLWRLLLDWPKLLGLPQHQEQFVFWHSALNAISRDQGNAETMRAELYRILLGMTAAEWKTIDCYAKFADWQHAGNGLLAPLVAALDHKENALTFVHAPSPCALMPKWRATEVDQIYAGQFDRSFASRPQYQGEPMETGMLAYRQHTPLLQDLMRQRPRRLLARLIARVADLLDSAEALATGKISGCVQGVGTSDGAGLSVVQTARGMLMHHVRIPEARIAEYLIVAPTEWNFHPQGALVKDLTGLQENDAERLMETVKYHVLSLDPCVEYKVEVAHA